MSGSLRLRDNHGSIRSWENQAASFDREGARDSRGAAPRWSVTLKVWGVLTLWCVWGATMIVAFLVGLSYGRHRGVLSALEEYSQESVRIPIPLAMQSPDSYPEPAPAENPAAQFPAAQFPAGSASTLQFPSSSLMSSGINFSSPLEAPAMSTIPAATAPVPAANPPVQGIKWIVKAATFRGRRQALAAEKRARDLKIPAAIDEGQRDGTKFFRLILGPFTSEQKAAAAKKQALRAKIVRGELYLQQLSPQ